MYVLPMVSALFHWGNTVKKSVLVLVCAASIAAMPALAGSLSDPVVAADIVAADAVDNSNAELQGMLAIIALGFILASAMGFAG